jgi:hypothetical protein
MAVWSSRKRLGNKGLRCKIHIRAIGDECQRPAKVYSQTCRGFDLGNITCCKNHASLLEKQGITLFEEE